MATVKDLVEHLEMLAPPHLADDWDQVGLQVGDPAWPANRVMLCIDLTEPVLDEAIEQDVQMIVAYHPLCFKPLARLTTQNVKQRIVLRAVQHQIAVYSPHTALDAADGGVNDWLTRSLGSGVVVPIRPQVGDAGSCKLVTFVPADHVDAIRDALAHVGAGQIGDYSHCTYMLHGQGTFIPGDSTQPTIGKRGLLKKVDEVRMEMVMPVNRMDMIVELLRKVHPYEEPAFDIYPLTRSSSDTPASGQRTGQGRLLQLDEPITLGELVQRVKKQLGVEHLEVSPADADARDKAVQRIGVCVGAGGSLLREAGKVDAFITGEMRHHDVLDAASRDIAILLAGHTQTERPYLATLCDNLQARIGDGVTWTLSERDAPPTKLW